MRLFTLLLLLVLCPIFLSNASFSGASNYIERYKDIAIEEMRKTGIPASIKLAQGMHESNYGQSRLATKGNNHFGIKCKRHWTGEKLYKTDDAPNECFRAYPSAYDSYMDHSALLTNGQRYSFLFKLDPTDYKSWAKGLKKAGYATNPKYAPIIISLVEKHRLYKYDQIVVKPDPMIVSVPEAPDHFYVPDKSNQLKETVIESKPVIRNKDEFLTAIPGNNIHQSYEICEQNNSKAFSTSAVEKENPPIVANNSVSPKPKPKVVAKKTSPAKSKTKVKTHSPEIVVSSPEKKPVFTHPQQDPDNYLAQIQHREKNNAAIQESEQKYQIQYFPGSPQPYVNKYEPIVKLQAIHSNSPAESAVPYTFADNNMESPKTGNLNADFQREPAKQMHPGLTSQSSGNSETNIVSGTSRTELAQRENTAALSTSRADLTEMENMDRKSKDEEIIRVKKNTERKNEYFKC